MIESHRVLLNRLIEKIFEAETNRHKTELTLLTEENDKTLGSRNDGFNYLGVNYGRENAIIRFAPNLNPKFNAEMHKLLVFQKLVLLDKQLISQMLSKLIQPCSSMSDIRDTLPECVVTLDPWLSKTYTRLREPACSIQDNERDLKQYYKCLPKIETYCAMRLIY